MSGKRYDDLSPAEREKVDYAAEVFLEFIVSAADGKDDDELVFHEAEIKALASACGVDFDQDVEPMTAGELRRNLRRGKAALARGDGP